MKNLDFINKSNISIDKIVEKYKYVILYILYFSRFLFFGFKYYPQLDDYIQYYSYSAFYSLSENISRLGLLSSRPLAGIMDIVFWSRFFENMIVAVAIISAMYVASAILFRKVFSKYVKIGNLFYIVYLFLPISIEGVYWISASSRIVVGMFLLSLSSYIFQKIYDADKALHKIVYTVMYVIFQFCSFALYEQIIVLGIAVYGTMFLLEFKNKNKIKYLLFTTFINIAIIFFIMKLNHIDSVYSSRLELILPNNTQEYQHKLTYLIQNFYKLFVVDNFVLSIIGFVNIDKLKSLAEVIISNYNFTYFKIMLSILFIIYLSTKRKDIYQLLAAVLFVAIAVSPISIFFFTESNYISYRNIVPSLLGIALSFDIFFSTFSYKIDKKVLKLLTIAIMLIFYISSVYEIQSYKISYENDTIISTQIAKYIDENDLSENNKLYIFNLKDSYVKDRTVFHNEHILGSMSSDWALKANVRYLLKKNELPDIMPLRANFKSFIETEDSNINNFIDLNYFIYYDFSKKTLLNLKVEINKELFKKNTIVYDIINEKHGVKIASLNFQKNENSNSYNMTLLPVGGEL